MTMTDSTAMIEKTNKVVELLKTLFPFDAWDAGTMHVITVSGGKDSTAMILLAKRIGVKFVCVFADTGHEHPLTYQYLDYLEATLDIKIRRVKADYTRYLHMKRERIQREWPATLTQDKPGRWEMRQEILEAIDDIESCTEISEEEFKRRMAALHIPPPPTEMPADPYAGFGTGYYYWVPAVRGISADQAAQRVADALEVLHPTCNPFLDMAMYHGRFPSTRVRFCTKELKVMPMQKQVQEPLLNEYDDVVVWQGVRAQESAARAKLPWMDEDKSTSGLWNFRPILDWLAQDVFGMHRLVGIEPNPLYKMGMARVGCNPCIHSKKAEVREIAQRFPEVIDHVEAMEKRVGKTATMCESTFFAASTIPGEGNRRANIRAVVQWANTSRGGRQQDMLNMLGEAPLCSSHYGLCE